MELRIKVIKWNPRILGFIKLVSRTSLQYTEDYGFIAINVSRAEMSVYHC